MPSVPSRAQNARTARREELRGELLEVIERLIGEGESFSEISVERLVAEVGISRTTFYVYFADKGEILSAWFAGIADELADALSAWWTTDAEPSREELRATIGRAVSAYQPHTALMAAAFHAGSYDLSVRELTRAFMDANIVSLRKHIKAGQRAGFVDPDLPGDDVATWLLWMAERGLHVILSEGGERQAQRQIDAYAAIVWNTLYAPTGR